MYIYNSGKWHGIFAADIELSSTIDTIPNPDCCQNEGAGEGMYVNCCNLRSAISFCETLESPCRISLAETTQEMDLILGNLVLGEEAGPTKVHISGPGSIVKTGDSTGSLFIFTGAEGQDSEFSLSSVSVTGFGDSSISFGGVMSFTGDVQINVTNAHFSANQGKYGGVIYMDQNSKSARFEDCSFSDNSAYYAGGAFYLDTSNVGVSISDCSFTNCIANGTFPDGGGAIFAKDGNLGLTIMDSNFDFCSGAQGGAVYLIQKNYFFKVSNSSFTDCTATNGDGGAILLDFENLDSSISDSLFNACTSVRGDVGGGIALFQGNERVTISDCLFNACTADIGGGIGLFSGNTFVTVSQCSFRHCQGRAGGGVGAYKGSTSLSILNSQFDSCEASFAGGGLYIDQNSPSSLMSNCSFTDCSSEEFGGAIAILLGNADLSLLNSTFHGNTTYIYTHSTVLPDTQQIRKQLLSQATKQVNLGVPFTYITSTMTFCAKRINSNLELQNPGVLSLCKTTMHAFRC